ncbi:unnamed protein product [Trichobilharzia regenti]|nr:unnamed protein product [Trichobilharzia regenti]
MMKNSYPSHHNQQQQHQRNHQSTLPSSKATSPSNLSINSLNHHYVLTNENLNFNFDEIRQELANLGVAP